MLGLLQNALTTLSVSDIMNTPGGEDFKTFLLGFGGLIACIVLFGKVTDKVVK